MNDERYLELLAEKYPTEQAVSREIINLTAILSLPKGTEHFMSDFQKLPNVYKVDTAPDKITLRCSKGKHNLIHVLDFLKKNEIALGRIYTELPTLIDVFLEITGKELRD